MSKAKGKKLIIIPWEDQVQKKMLGCIGISDPKPLQEAMLHLLRQATTDVEMCTAGRKFRYAKRLCSLLRVYLAHVDMQKRIVDKMAVSHPSLSDLTAAILSLMLDLQILLSSRPRNKVPVEDAASQIIQDVLILTGSETCYVWDTLLQSTSLKEKWNKQLGCIILERLIADTPWHDHQEPEPYLKCLLCMRLWYLHSSKAQKPQVRVQALSIPVPKYLSRWLKSQSINDLPQLAKKDQHKMFVKPFLKMMSQDVADRLCLALSEDMMETETTCISLPVMDTSKNQLFAEESTAKENSLFTIDRAGDGDEETHGESEVLLKQIEEDLAYLPELPKKAQKRKGNALLLSLDDSDLDVQSSNDGSVVDVPKESSDPPEVAPLKAGDGPDCEKSTITKQRIKNKISRKDSVKSGLRKVEKISSGKCDENSFPEKMCSERKVNKSSSSLMDSVNMLYVEKNETSGKKRKSRLSVPLEKTIEKLGNRLVKRTSKRKLFENTEDLLKKSHNFDDESNSTVENLDLTKYDDSAQNIFSSDSGISLSKGTFGKRHLDTSATVSPVSINPEQDERVILTNSQSYISKATIPLVSPMKILKREISIPEKTEQLIIENDDLDEKASDPAVKNQNESRARNLDGRIKHLSISIETSSLSSDGAASFSDAVCQTHLSSDENSGMKDCLKILYPTQSSFQTNLEESSPFEKQCDDNCDGPVASQNLFQSQASLSTNITKAEKQENSSDEFLSPETTNDSMPDKPIVDFAQNDNISFTGRLFPKEVVSPKGTQKKNDLSKSQSPLSKGSPAGSSVKDANIKLSGSPKMGFSPVHWHLKRIDSEIAVRITPAAEKVSVEDEQSPNVPCGSNHINEREVVDLEADCEEPKCLPPVSHNKYSKKLENSDATSKSLLLSSDSDSSVLEDENCGHNMNRSEKADEEPNSLRKPVKAVRTAESVTKHSTDKDFDVSKTGYDMSAKKCLFLITPNTSLENTSPHSNKEATGGSTLAPYSFRTRKSCSKPEIAKTVGTNEQIATSTTVTGNQKTGNFESTSASDICKTEACFGTQTQATSGGLPVDAAPVCETQGTNMPSPVKRSLAIEKMKHINSQVEYYLESISRKGNDDVGSVEHSQSLTEADTKGKDTHHISSGEDSINNASSCTTDLKQMNVSDVNQGDSDLSSTETLPNTSPRHSFPGSRNSTSSFTRKNAITKSKAQIPHVHLYSSDSDFQTIPSSQKQSARKRSLLTKEIRSSIDSDNSTDDNNNSSWKQHSKGRTKKNYVPKSNSSDSDEPSLNLGKFLRSTPVDRKRQSDDNKQQRQSTRKPLVSPSQLSPKPEEESLGKSSKTMARPLNASVVSTPECGLQKMDDSTSEHKKEPTPTANAASQTVLRSRHIAMIKTDVEKGDGISSVARRVSSLRTPIRRTPSTALTTRSLAAKHTLVTKRNSVKSTPKTKGPTKKSPIKNATDKQETLQLSSMKTGSPEHKQSRFTRSGLNTSYSLRSRMKTPTKDVQKK